MQTCGCPVVAASESLTYELCSVVSEVAVLLVLSIFSGSYIPSGFSSAGFPEFGGEGFDGNILFKNCVFEGFTLPNVWLWVPLFVHICCRRKFL